MERLAKRYTGNPEAYRDFVKGRFCYNKVTEEGLKKSIGHFEEAIRKDPNYALACAGLADSHGLFAFFSPPASQGGDAAGQRGSTEGSGA